MEGYFCRVRAPVNIALLKYWGKKDPESGLNLPLHDSLSITLDPRVMHTETSATLSSDIPCDRIILNGHPIKLTSRMKTIIAMCRKLSTIPGSELKTLNVSIESCNNFPTAAGLASSASGMAALAQALSVCFKIDGAMIDRSLVSTIARLGSGSACRSIDGGFVIWSAGFDHNSSKGISVYSPEWWPDLGIAVAVVSDQKKSVGSTIGMQKTVETSRLFQQRLNGIESTKKSMMEAIKNKDFDRLAMLTIRDGNEMHACCLDTNPPLNYRTDTSFQLIQMCHMINDIAQSIFGHLLVAYTFDAGPNAVILTRDRCTLRCLSKMICHLTQTVGSEGESVAGLKRKCLICRDKSKEDCSSEESNGRGGTKTIGEFNGERFLFDPLDLTNDDERYQPSSELAGLFERVTRDLEIEMDHKMQLQKLIITQIGSGTEITDFDLRPSSKL